MKKRKLGAWALAVLVAVFVVLSGSDPILIRSGEGSWPSAVAALQKLASHLIPHEVAQWFMGTAFGDVVLLVIVFLIASAGNTFKGKKAA